MSEQTSWEGLRQFRVDRKIPESDTITSFYLVPVDDGSLASYLPGQFLGFKLNVPGQSEPVRRTYTISEEPGVGTYYRLSIKREPAPAGRPDLPPGVSSNYFHDDVGEGSVIDVRAPRGDFHLDTESRRPVVLLSGGVGLTPMISMLGHICDEETPREVRFMHGARNGREHAFGDHVRGLAAGHPNVNVRVLYSRPDGGDRPGTDFDRAGRVTVDYLMETLPGRDFDFYLCGPTAFMKDLYDGLLTWGVPETDIHYEFFGPAQSLAEMGDGPRRETAVETDSAGDFEVTFSRSGISAAWNGFSDNILELAEGAGLNPDSSCRSGNCHTCLCTVKSGTFEYTHDDIFEPDGEDEILICSARPTSDLEIDL